VPMVSDHVDGCGLHEVRFAAGDLDVAVVVARQLATIDGVTGQRWASILVDTVVSPTAHLRQTVVLVQR